MPVDTHAGTVDDFETGFGNWTNVTGDKDDWYLDKGSTLSSNTGPNHDNTIGDSTGWSSNENATTLSATPGHTKNILLTGYWPPTNEMLRKFSTNPDQNPDGWQGQNWKGRGYDVYAYFPEFPGGTGSSPKGDGDFEVDYQDTSQDFWQITNDIHPVAILSYGQGAGPWEIEYNARNLSSWNNDYESPTQPTPAPPDNSVPAGYVRNSTLPVQAIADAINNAGIGVSAWVDWSGNPGAFLCEYMAYHDAWYQSLHSDASDSYRCLVAGFTHVASSVSVSNATAACEIALRQTIYYLDSQLEPSFTLTIDVVSNGSVTKTPDQADYTYGTVVDVNAIADPGWTFDSWSGDLTGSTNPNSITMDDNKTITATFTEFLLSDNFDDNRRSAMWRSFADDYGNAWVSEDANRLNVKATGNVNGLVAFYVANGWSFDANESFAVEVDFHYSGISDQNGWVGITVENDDTYASISAGSDSYESYFYYEGIVDGNMVLEQELRGSSDGTLYISYDADSNSVYLSHIGYGSENADKTLQIQWTSAVDVAVGSGSDGVAISSGDAYLDDFEIATATLLGWPPATDLDSDGFIDWGDVEVIRENWLVEGPDVPGDINNDGTVNFLDFAEFGLAW